MNKDQIINHIYANRPKSLKAMKRQTGMNQAFIKAAIVSLDKDALKNVKSINEGEE